MEIVSKFSLFWSFAGKYSDENSKSTEYNLAGIHDVRNGREHGNRVSDTQYAHFVFNMPHDLQIYVRLVDCCRIILNTRMTHKLYFVFLLLYFIALFVLLLYDDVGG